MFHARAANIRCKMYCSTFWDIEVKLNTQLVGFQNPKSCYSTCHIECLRLMHGALNVDEKKLITQFGGKLRDERFESN